MDACASFATWAVAIFTVHESSYFHRDVDALESSFGPRRSFVQRLGLTLGYNTEANFFKAFADTVACVAYPPVL
jgi:hypothetical protein